MTTERLPLVNSYIEYWAGKTPGAVAMIQHEDGRSFTYKKFASLIDFFALRLLDMGIRKGDTVATLLVLLPEHMMLMYACFKIGAIIAPLDARLKDDEVVREIDKIQAKAFFFLGNTPVRDFRTAGQAVKKSCPCVKHFIQFTPDPQPGDIMEGAVSITGMMEKKRLIWLKVKDMVTGGLKKAYSRIDTRTPALIIFTTGTTGEPKPALICHENIIVQNQILQRGSAMKKGSVLINLPPSHVGCVTELFMTAMFVGATAVMLRIFDVALSLEAIEKHHVTAIGMIPTQYRMMWARPDYDKYDLSSLELAACAGSAVDVAFLKRLAAMAPAIGTGIGMTENAGFATFTPPGIGPEEMAGQVGQSFPDLAEVTIRKPMNHDGTAGEQLPDGEVGEICYHPPIVFLGYYNQPEATAKTISREGILYTGDIGYFKDMGSYRALYLSGRQKFMIKQKGYKVFPDEIEDHIVKMEKVDAAEVVGMKHEMFDDGVFAFVRVKKDCDLTAEEVMEHCKGIASYKRPQHVEIWQNEKEFPLTRTAKVDKLTLQKIAGEIIERLRAQGGWDAG
ncbi:MAG: long-chain fatty acid--CoA ligase [Spirochaetae bacterium HGW-Spirochaetae-1]|jgi:acyl-CoA synthetase (AMP-forming)/AMP-acid ligase II|nr:MAG: long-chain fatty acid--CoA ligase [Spirochaetae bacterium HGW-Spirochaetae-1]